MPALLARLSAPLLATLRFISNCSADVMPAASISSLVKEVIGNDSSMSARLMREPVTVMRSRFLTWPLGGVAGGSACCAIAGRASAASRARQRRLTLGIVRTGMEFPPREQMIVDSGTARSVRIGRLPCAVVSPEPHAAKAPRRLI